VSQAGSQERGKIADPKTTTATGRRVPFVDLRPTSAGIADDVEAAIRRVLASGWFILGEEVGRFERHFAEYCGAAFAVGVGNGTDAIALGLKACGVEPGDEVITVAHTALPTLCAISQIGAIPVLVDIEPDTATMDPRAIEAAITGRTRAIVPVHLYGQAADMTAILTIAQAHGLAVVEDCAQAHGAQANGRSVGALGNAGAFSFYPTKNLGAIGDGGMVTTNDPAVAERLRLLRNYGQTDRYRHKIVGVNSRLDELQAAILDAKLRYLDEWTERRRALAARYAQGLAGLLQLPVERPWARHVFHLYAVQTPRRDELQRALAAAGVDSIVHYPIPAHLQEAYLHLGVPKGTLPHTERVAADVLSLPLYPELRFEDVDYVCEIVHAALGTAD
jgi:dTDP-3-amino-3,4,6-trideoxy-alpha-D-glucose transaminase